MKEIEYRGQKIRKVDHGYYEAYTLPTPTGSHPYPTAKNISIVKSMIDRILDKAQASNT